MKKIMATTVILALCCAFFLTNSIGRPKIAGNEVSVFADSYANDTLPKKHKRKSDTTRRDTTGLALSVAALNNK